MMTTKLTILSMTVLGAVALGFGCDQPAPTEELPLQQASTAEDRTKECPDLCADECSGTSECSKPCNVVAEFIDDRNEKQTYCKSTTCAAEVPVTCSTDPSTDDDPNTDGDSDGDSGEGPWVFCDSFKCTQIAVHTCNVDGAGTDSRVSMTLSGPHGTTQPFRLDHPNKDDHERNKWFDKTFGDPEGVRSPTSFTIHHDGSRDHSRWCFDSVFVRVSACPGHDDWEEFSFNGARFIDGGTVTLGLTQTKFCNE